jgi:hypothetical protein
MTGEHEVRVRTESLPALGPRAARLSLTIDGQTVSSAEVPILYAVHGDAYIGRPGLGTLLPDRELAPLVGAAVSAVEIDTQSQ